MKKFFASRLTRWGMGGFLVILLIAGVAKLLYLAPLPETPPPDWNAVLVEAATQNDYVRAGFALGKGAQADALDAAGTPMLARAAENGSCEVMTLLLDHGAKLETADALGRTPLVLAAGNGKLAAVRLLLTRGANVNSGATAGQTALLAACAAGDCAIIEELLNCGAMLWPGCPDGRGPMVTALANHHVEAAHLLLASGANPNEHDAEGNSVLMLAEKLNAQDLVQELRATGGISGSQSTQGKAK